MLDSGWLYSDANNQAVSPHPLRPYLDIEVDSLRLALLFVPPSAGHCVLFPLAADDPIGSLHKKVTNWRI